MLTVDVASVPSTDPSLSVEDAIAKAETALSGKFNEHPPTLEFVAKKDGSLALTHVVQIQNDDTGAWVEAFVDAHSGEIVQLTDFVTKITVSRYVYWLEACADTSLCTQYRVLPITKETLLEGFENLVDPQNPAASPDGWHSDGTTSTTTTSGNNIIAYKGSTTSLTSQSSSGLVFNYPASLTTSPTTTANVHAGRVNAFYVGNSIHDILYRYGFTEAAFNFQNNNFNKGGKGNDRVTVSVQDSAGTDNADFSTPAEYVLVRLLRMLVVTNAFAVANRAKCACSYGTSPRL